jgi:hypothetical protein
LSDVTTGKTVSAAGGRCGATHSYGLLAALNLADALLGGTVRGSTHTNGVALIGFDFVFIGSPFPNTHGKKDGYTPVYLDRRLIFEPRKLASKAHF